MPTVNLWRDGSGEWRGVSEKDQSLFTRFAFLSKKLDMESLIFSWKEPRSPKHHRHFFRRINGLFSRQEKFSTEEMLRKWLLIGAEYVDFVPWQGQLVPVPKSISWEKMDQGEFVRLDHAVMAFMWSSYAQGTLWPHLSPSARFEMVDVWVLEYSR